MNEAVVEREVSFTGIWSYYAMVMKKRVWSKKNPGR